MSHGTGRAGAPMFALLNGASVFGGVVGPISVGLVADVLGLRLAIGLLAIAPVFWLGSLLLIRERDKA